jgi:dTDP-4-dehydrorhamnose reductase
MKVLVTGSDGQLAKDLVPLLDIAGYETLSLNYTALDITDKEAVLKAVEISSPEIIINCASYTQVDKAEEESKLAFQVNGDGAANIAEAALTSNALLIHISTDFVFDGLKSTPYTELDATNPLSVYGKSKLKGEDEILKRACDSLIIRTSWLYGTCGKNFVKTILRLAKERAVLEVVDDQVGSPTWTVDLAGVIAHIAALRAAGSIHTGIYNYSNRGEISWYDFAVAIVEEARINNVELKCDRVEPIESSAYPTPAERPPYSVLSTKEIERDFNISIPDWRVSLKKMLEQLYGETDA